MQSTVRRVIHPDDRDTHDGIPITSVARTLVDLADVLSPTHLAAAVNEAEVQRRFDRKQIDKVLARVPGRTGRHRLAKVLDQYTEPPGYDINAAERLLVGLCERHGLPRPQRVSMTGYELDFYWRDARLAIEVDVALSTGPGEPSTRIGAATGGWRRRAYRSPACHGGI